MASPVRTRSPGAQLAGVHEAAELLGISKAALADRRRDASFPAPVAELRCGPVWRVIDLERYHRRFERARWNSPS